MCTITLKKKSKAIIIPDVKLKGPRGIVDIDMLLDTGAFYSIVSRSNAVRLGYTFSDDQIISIITGNGFIQAHLILLKSVAVGDMRVRNLHAICHDVPEMGCVRGYLGLNFLKCVRTVIDYHSRRLEIS